MKKIACFLLVFFAVAGVLSAQSIIKIKFHLVEVKTIDGKRFPLRNLKGKKVMVVNTASECGLTPQFATLEALYEKYGADGKFVIIGFPSDDFHQELDTNSEIQEFCTANYAVTFPMMEKISVKGDDMHMLYRWLTTKEMNGVKDAPVTWNFQKFLIDEEGNWVDVLSPTEKPDSEKVMSWLEGE